ncbi:MAG: GDP-fucose synthetase [Gammaproteobacteria bacterium RIFCSPLOWO2_02_FULL_47_50]|nr:MAG: GDP-fucose synthetase [Gammaproteobacteria bacterium RIFCSPLOWO2_12_47_11]OGT78840.1 MAG: GDP-fucose synthetase [Gammaproteobacteria bacterium RIFCSPLOWO2_02_FULL_47_50]
MNRNDRIYIAGHTGLVGSAIMRRLHAEGCSELISGTHSELDLSSQSAVDAFFSATRPDYVFLAAARVGGIQANSNFPAEFIYSNLSIQTNVIHAAWKNNVKKLLFLGSSCIYPKHAPQPINEDYLLTGPLETTNEWYAVAKIAGIKMCQAYRRQYGFNAIAVMPTNLYGPGDNFDLENSHVLPALLRKFHEAKIRNKNEVIIWGSGKPRREFMHVDDLADACVFLMKHYEQEKIINAGTGKDISISELAYLIKEISGFHGSLEFDTSKPDGTPRKLLDVSRLSELGWKAGIGFEQGIKDTYDWYVRQDG